MRYSICAFIAVSALALFLSQQSVVLAVGEVARPTTSPTDAPKDETPVDMMRRGCKVYDLLDVQAAENLFYSTNPAEKHCARMMAECGIAIARAEQHIRSKFGKDCSDAFIRAIGEHTNEEIETAEIKVQGEEAQLTWKGDTSPSIIMHRVDGAWKFAVHEFVGAMNAEQLRDFEKGIVAEHSGVDAVIRDVKDAKLRTAEEVIAAGKKVAEQIDAGAKNEKK